MVEVEPGWVTESVAALPNPATASVGQCPLKNKWSSIVPYKKLVSLYRTMLINQALHVRNTYYIGLPAGALASEAFQ
jgi:hypothetical protein